MRWTPVLAVAAAGLLLFATEGLSLGRQGLDTAEIGLEFEESLRFLVAIPASVATGLDGGLASGVVLGLAGLFVFLLGAALIRRSQRSAGPPRARVQRLARRGWSTPRIARRTGLAQDLVRVLADSESDPFAVSPEGRTFRSARLSAWKVAAARMIARRTGHEGTA